jgi:hypothetical protein
VRSDGDLLRRRRLVAVNSASLNVVRRYAGSDGKVFEVTIGRHPPHRYTYNFHLKREQPVRPKRVGKGRGSESGRAGLQPPTTAIALISMR